MTRTRQLRSLGSVIVAGLLSAGASPAFAQGGNSACGDLPSHAVLRAALSAAQSAPNGGFGLEMWASVVNRDGVVCAVAFTGGNRGDQWPGSRVISAQKANTANAFSLRGLALSTANLFTAVQPGGSLFGLQESNPVSTLAAYGGSPDRYGRSNDPMVGERIGGVNVFGGGLALYDSSHAIVGGVGVSGDTSCADHNIAWRTRHTLNLDFVPGGVGPDSGRADNINYQTLVPVPSLQNDFSHPICSIAGVDGVSAISAALPVTQ